MQVMSIKEYAVSHKLSIYNVVKMAKNGSLETQMQKIDGKEEMFIVLKEKEENVDLVSSASDEGKIGDYEKAYFKLKIKYDQLKIKYDKLNNSKESNG
jgi:hypothetical protein